MRASGSRPPEAVFDTGPLIYLDAVGYAGLLPRLHRVVVPPTVADELAARPAMPGGRLPEQPWLQQRSPQPNYLGHVEQEPPSVDKGEKEAIALALQRGALVVADDLPARKRARRAGLEVSGTLGILLRLHRLGLLQRSLGSELDRLQQAGMYLSEELREVVLRGAITS